MDEDLLRFEARLLALEWMVAEALARTCSSSAEANALTDRLDNSIETVIARSPDLDPTVEAEGRIAYDALLASVRAIAHAMDVDGRSDS